MVILENEAVDSSSFFKFMRGGFDLMDLSDIDQDLIATAEWANPTHGRGARK